jgi:adaptin ear-binding coat-associated protein 1/2
MSGFEDDMGNEHELCVIRRVYAFKLPVLKNAQGHRATDWDKNPVWKGRLRIVEQSNKCRIMLEHEDKDGIFGTCPVYSDTNKPPCYEPVLDSSRYFVLRLEDGKGNYAYLGIAFNTRDEAFEFKVALRDYVKFAEAEDEIKKVDKSDIPSVDYSLKGKITLGSNVSSSKKNSKKKHNDEEDEDDQDQVGKKMGGLSLAPPPEPAGKSRSRRKSKNDEQIQESPEKPVASNKGQVSADILGLDF